jgi:hypothetical protein
LKVFFKNQHSLKAQKELLMKKPSVVLFFIFAVAAHSNNQQNQVGKCTDNDRRDYIYRGNTDFNHNWRACGKSSSGSASGTTACLKRSYHELSQECAQCFGDFVGCARSHCWTQCWSNPDSADCEACGNSHCQSGLISCSGIQQSSCHFLINYECLISTHPTP